MRLSLLKWLSSAIINLASKLAIGACPVLTYVVKLLLVCCYRTTEITHYRCLQKSFEVICSVPIVDYG